MKCWSSIIYIVLNGPFYIAYIKWADDINANLEVFKCGSAKYHKSDYKAWVVGWVQRLDGEDKREKIVTLSAQAEERLPAITATILAFEEEMVGSLTAEEQQQFLKLLEKWKVDGHAARREYTDMDEAFH